MLMSECVCVCLGGFEVLKTERCSFLFGGDLVDTWVFDASFCKWTAKHSQFDHSYCCCLLLLFIKCVSLIIVTVVVY